MGNYWLGVDFETTGLNTQTDSIIEVGAVLWDVSRHVPAMQYGALIKVDAPISEEITRITGITKDDTEKFGISFASAMKNLAPMFSHASHFVAHNGTNFDRPIFDAELKRIQHHFLSQPWIDSAVDVDYPAHISTRKLSHLAAEHGFINPFAHRAVSDVLTMLTIMSKYDSAEIEKWAASAPVTLQARVSYDDRHLASARGYRWDNDRKVWIKTVKDFKVDEEVSQAKFQVVRFA